MTTNEPIFEDNWKVLQSLFPSTWKELASLTGANTRLRGFDSVEQLMRTLLIHIAHGYSLRETVTRAKASGLADVSDVALLKRLKNSKDWFRQLCVSLLCERGAKFPNHDKSRSIRLIDATIVKEQGVTGSRWRILYSLRLPELHCDHFELTSDTGAGNGETFCRIPVEKGDHIIGDRAYSTVRGVEYVAESNAYSLVRLNQQVLPLWSENEKKFPTLQKLQILKRAGENAQWRCLYSRKEKKDTRETMCYS